MAHGDLRNSIIEKMKEQGYSTKGFRSALRKQLQVYFDEEWESYIQSGDYEGEEKDEMEEPWWVTPTAWRRFVTNDCNGREWVVFECVEPMTSKLSKNKLRNYLDIWDFLDYSDNLIALELVLMSRDGGKYPLDLKSLFFQNIPEHVAEQRGAVDRSVYMNEDKN